MNLANKLTLSRMLMAPVVVVLLHFPGPATCMCAALAFVFASITDWADGYIARRENTVTSFGKFLDPLADKILICSVLIVFVRLDWVPAWVTLVIVCRELFITGLRAIAIDEGIVLAADSFGKAKTVLQSIALVPLIWHYPFFGLDLRPAGMALLYAALVLAVFSGVNYTWNFYRKGFARPGPGGSL